MYRNVERKRDSDSLSGKEQSCSCSHLHTLVKREDSGLHLTANHTKFSEKTHCKITTLLLGITLKTYKYTGISNCASINLR